MENELITFLVNRKKSKNKIMNFFRFLKITSKIEKEEVNFDVLLKYNNFLNLLEKMFYYDNSKRQRLSSRFNYKIDANVISITLQDIVVVDIYLYNEDKTISVTINRFNGRKMSSQLSDVSEIKLPYDEFITDTIYDALKQEIIALVDKYSCLSNPLIK